MAKDITRVPDSICPAEQQYVEQKPDQTVDELATARARIAELEAANRALAETAGSDFGNFPRDIRTTGPKIKRWKFAVSCPRDITLPVKEIEAVDESEAIRLYVLTALDGGKKVLDTVKYRIVAECKEPRDRKAYGLRRKQERNAEMGYDLQAVGGKV